MYFWTNPMYHCACIRHDVIVPLSTQFRNHKVNKVGNKGKISIKPPGGPPPGGPGYPLVGGSLGGGGGLGGPSAFWVSLLPVSYKNLPLASFKYNF